MRLHTPDMQAVLERLEKLERQNRRIKWAGATAVLMGVLSLVHCGPLGQMRRDTIEAHRFVLLDDEGRMRGEMTAEFPTLSFYDKAGVKLMSLGDDFMEWFNAADPPSSAARILLQSPLTATHSSGLRGGT